MTIALAVFLLAAAAASITDLRTRKIPNALSYAAMAAALACSAVAGGLTAFFLSFLSLAVTIVLGSIVFGLGWLGGGDVKLLAAAAATVAFPNFFALLVDVGLAGGVLALAAAIASGKLQAVFGGLARSLVYRVPIAPASGVRRLPYGLAIFAGSAVYAASESVAPWLRLVH